MSHTANTAFLHEETASLCPVCLERLPARRVARGASIYLEKTCPQHGSFSTILWRDSEAFSYNEWVAGAAGDEAPAPQCPTACGICGAHKQATCCVLLEVTARCDQDCPVCYAGGGGNTPDPDIETLLARLAAFEGASKPFVYLTGGEPALRDDLPLLIGRILEMGFPHVQLNTNGKRLATDPAYVQALADAGLSFVFMQFDGVTDGIHQAIRGEPLQAVKEQAIANCDEAGLGVTLVPTVIPGVNLDALGDIIRFGAAHSPAVRGIHFQPITYMGRCAAPPRDEGRATLPEVLEALCADGLVRPENLLPSACDHPLCGFHGAFMVDTAGKLIPLSRPKEPACCCTPQPVAVEKNRDFVSRRWKRETETGPDSNSAQDITTLDGFLSRSKSHGFTLTGMAFQDAWNLDLQRLCRCSLHVVDEAGSVSPFCAHYLTSADGRRLHDKRRAFSQK